MVDIERICSIKINKDYVRHKKYPVFQNINNENEWAGLAQCSIIFGNNGSGKSTIAQAFKSKTNHVDILDDNDNLIEGELENIYLFDEKFIINNFRKLEDDYLGSIVLLGEAVQVQEEIDKLRQELRKKPALKMILKKG